MMLLNAGPGLTLVLTVTAVYFFLANTFYQREMSAETVQLLITRYMNSLQEMEESRRKQFVEIEVILRRKIGLHLTNEQSEMLIQTLYELNDILMECQSQSEKRKKKGISLRELYRISTTRSDLSKIKRLLQNLPDASSPTPIVGPLAQVSELLQMPPVYGFDSRRDEIVSSLLQESCDVNNTIGIVGMGGSGKTTLAKMVYNHITVKKEFMPRIWITLSNKSHGESNFTWSIVKHLLEDIWEDGEAHNANNSLDNQLVMLHKHLSGKKYLIVFDDVWHINSWYEKLVNQEKSGFPKEHGGRVIVTSRLEEDVGKMVGVSNVHRLLPMLDTDSCWSIFTEVAEQNKISIDHSVLQNMKVEILDNCSGLPLAARTIGEIISKKVAATRPSNVSMNS